MTTLGYEHCPDCDGLHSLLYKLDPLLTVRVGVIWVAVLCFTSGLDDDPSNMNLAPTLR